MESSVWNIPEVFSGDISAFNGAGLGALLSAALLSRGIATPADAAAYLATDLSSLSDPFSLSDMDKAVKRIETAMSRGEAVAVYGDYDVDGITASCLLCDYLKSRGLDCRIYIPDRIDEGYGLNAPSLEALRRDGVTLAITVDCGITAAAEAEFAKGIGLDIIITDHHECPKTLPDCCAVVSPKRQEAERPAAFLAGVGVAMKLACALEGSAEEITRRYCDLVAVGTIADVMPLLGENRALTFAGLKKLRQNPRPGLAALIEEAGAAEKPLTATLVGYTLAPRINAAGRLCETSKSVDLLMCEDRQAAQELARGLCELNRRRQELELEVWNEAAALLEKSPPDGPIVLASENWHSGVVGIAASRLAEAYRLPAVMICLDGENGKGSCRSCGDYNLFEAIAACGDYLEGYGGHAFAAGLSIKAGKIDAFRAALKAYYDKNVPETRVELAPELQLADFSYLTMEGVEALDALEPCGCGNPRPLLCVRDVVLETVTAIGGGRHLRIVVKKGGQSLDGVFFAKTQEELGLAQGDIADICFTPQINDYRAQRNVQLMFSGARESETARLCRETLADMSGLPPEAEALSLSRDELSDIWRVLRAAGRGFRLAELFSDTRFERVEPVKVCLAIRVFAELALLDAELDGQYIKINVRENADKASLDDSPLFRLLAKNRRAE